MSAQVYTEMPQAPPLRRQPLSNTNHNAYNYRQPLPRPLDEPVKHRTEPPKPPASPPLPRQNAKVTPPSPPRVITDLGNKIQLSRLGLLGEGGFARVYEVKDPNGVRWACKVVTRSSLKTKKAKTKLYAEIRIHKSLRHPNIVMFQECFEDTDNVYMTLELCHHGSLMDMLRRRKRFTEPEARFFMVQLIGACHYMHNCQVIHRDLKLGNIFLDMNMNVKVGDFGLAALIENPGERKKTICGTPNYIAPEVLFDTANGHSFEVDTWSIGVILYTLVIGRPPFQTKDVKAIYKRIRDNEYDFPVDRVVSAEVKDLIQIILTPNPQERPTLHEILDHQWFTQGIVPSRIPTSAHDIVPNFSHITRAASEANLAALRRATGLDDDTASIAVPSAPAAPTGRSRSASASTSLAQQEKDFQKAVQPGSPISVLLSSARQPLLVGTAAPRGDREQPLLRKLQAAKVQSQSQGQSSRSPARERERLQGIDEEQDGAARAEEHRKKELESQKARIVAQMVPSAPTGPYDDLDQENVPPREHRGAHSRGDRDRARERTAAALAGTHHRKPSATESASAQIPSSSSGAQGVRVSGFEAVAQVLVAAFEARAQGRVFRDPRADSDLPEPKVFIVSWVDYCNKYGMGYALTDGSVGVHFNDSTTIVLSPDKIHFDYVSSRRQGSVYVRKNYTASEYPEELKSKVYLVKHFERYIMDRLYGDYDYTFVDHERTKGMDFVQKYLRMKQVIIFKMSHDVIQFNFYDHSKVILSSQGLLVTHIDKNYNLARFSLSEIIAASLSPPVADPDQAKLNQRLLEKCKYCRDVLVTIVNAAQAQSSPAPEAHPEAAPAPVPSGTSNAIHTLTTRASNMKISLR